MNYLDISMPIEFIEADNTLHLPLLRSMSKDFLSEIQKELEWSHGSEPLADSKGQLTLEVTQSGTYKAIVTFPEPATSEKLGAAWKALAGRKGIDFDIKSLQSGRVRFVGEIEVKLEGNTQDPTPVRLTRTSAPASGDVGLWMMIRESSERLSWKNYEAAMNMVLTCGENHSDKFNNVHEKTEQLAARRSLPYTGTDSYHALKVATEAFLLVNAPPVPDGKYLSQIEFGADTRKYLKWRMDYSWDKVKPEFKSYLEPNVRNNGKGNVIPYLYQVAKNLQGTEAGAQAEAKLDQWRDSCRDDPDMLLGCWKSEAITKLRQPLLIELIWSYWMEEMQLVQTMHAISRRFQNVHSIGARDPLAQLDADSLRPLGNLMWGYVQDEQHRLTLARRAYEYSHHYGVSLIGKAVPQLHPADNRSKFIEAFHNLLSLCAQFFRQVDDTTVVADAFMMLNALREVHLLLSEGAGNQFRDLPATARAEMMMEQWMLARPEFREFLPRRNAIAYPDAYMHSVDSMRRLQGWGDTNVLHFWHLATCGERVVSSMRWGDWNNVQDPEYAANWAKFFRPDIQAYIHAYRAVTGVDITLEPVDATMPSVHLFRRQSAPALKRA